MLSPYTIIDYSLPLRMSEDKFFKHVKIDSDGCWIWTGSNDGKDGYGHYWYSSYSHMPAHRKAYEISRGIILKTLQYVCHHCDKPACVKPICLFQCTQQENVDDAISKGRFPHGESHGMSKITQIQAEEIKRLLATRKYKQTEIAKLLNISKFIINRIATGVTWKN